MTTEPSTALSFSSSPYPGLRPFRSDESDIFFGREEQTDRLLERLGRAHFLAVVGPSGCGKSSLARAGMVAALETGFMADAGSRWRIAELRPGIHPMTRLAGALADSSALGAERGSDPSVAAFIEAQLRRGPLGLRDILQETPLPPSANLLVLVDQFEEIFRFREKGNRDEADAFVALLLATAAERCLPVYVFITMRSDFLGDCALFAGLPEAINDSQYLTPRLTREQCRAAIAGPARVFGGDVEPALVNRLLNDFGPDPDQLPLLQHALMRMWSLAGGRDRDAGARTLTVADYSTLGGLTSALSNHADEAFGELTPEQQRIAEVMFRRLCERGVGKRDMRSPAYLSEVAQVAGVDSTAVMAVVDAFRRIDRSFVTPPPAIPLTPDTLLDIGHESLIRQWRRLAGWVDDETRTVVMYHRLRQTAQLWKAGDAALWGSPDLERALRWEAEQKPSVPWAARYGTRAEFDLAMQFLRESEAAWREGLARAEAEREHARQEEIRRQTQAEREARLRDQARSAHKMKLLAGGLAIGLVATIGMAVFAWLQAGWAADARIQAQIERDNVRTLWTAAQAAEATQVATTKGLTTELARARAVVPAAKHLPPGAGGAVMPPPAPPSLAPAAMPNLKDAFLAGDQDVIARYLAAPQAERQIRFTAGRRNLGYEVSAGRPAYEWWLAPLLESIPGGPDALASVTFRFDHATFRNKLLSAGREQAFRATYIGWGCLSQVLVLVEYTDAARPPGVTTFDMCAAAQANTEPSPPARVRLK